MKKPRKQPKMMSDHALYHHGFDLAMHLRGFGAGMMPGEVLTILLAAFAVILEDSEAMTDGSAERLIDMAPVAIRNMMAIHADHMAQDGDEVTDMPPQGAA